jgi:predicted GIY-YIG superfamily endonuclease
MQGIYRIYDIDTGITYIGQSKDIEERWKAHERHFKNRSDGQRDVYRLILRPQYEIIEEVPDAADLD